MIPPDDVEVWLDEEETPLVLVGTLRPSFQGGRSLASTSFQYAPSFLQSGTRYEISPDLPLVSSRSYAPEDRALFGAFADAAPDEWGRKIIQANHAQKRKAGSALPAKIGDFDFLIDVADHTRMGALRLRSAVSEQWLSSESGVANLHDLKRILQVTRRYEANEASDADVEYLNDVATSPGGARPKANVVLADGTLAIAKLPHSKDGDIDVERWEALALTLAKACGIQVPAWNVNAIDDSKAILILHRFDRTAASRRGYLSAASAMQVGRYDDHRLTYEDFADAIAHLSSQPKDDLRQMFIRIALTILINNVDDHWRNHGFIHSRFGWRLAPAFDINPNPRHGSITSRAVNADDDPRDRDIRNLVKISSAFQLTQPVARETVAHVAGVVRDWRRIAATLDLSPSQQELMSPAFDESQLERAQSPD